MPQQSLTVSPPRKLNTAERDMFQLRINYLGVRRRRVILARVSATDSARLAPGVLERLGTRLVFDHEDRVQSVNQSTHDDPLLQL